MTWRQMIITFQFYAYIPYLGYIKIYLYLMTEKLEICIKQNLENVAIQTADERFQMEAYQTKFEAHTYPVQYWIPLGI